VVALSRSESTVLTLFFFSFAYVLVSTIVPDHFIISMMLLLLSLYVSGKLMLKKRELSIWQTILLFLFTAGTSLNNGVKIFFSGLIVNGRRFFRPRNLLLAVILPSALIWGFARWEYATFVWERETAQHEAKKKKAAERKIREHQMQIAQARQDSIDTAHGDTAALNARKAKAEEAKAKTAKRRHKSTQGKPIGNGEFMRWTDITSSRSQSIVENLFGESIQLHPDNLLGDTMRGRPMIVKYRWWWNYVLEGIIVALFLAGILLGRKERFLWLVLSYFGMDMLLHIGLGFGINEVYIMSAHWIYAIPIAIAYILKRRQQAANWLLPLLVIITIILFIYNVELITEYLIM